jgi:L-fuculose-phosphate aldolase
MSVDYLDLKEEIIATCLRLEELGYVIGTYGNVSARVETGLLITPSRVDYRLLQPEDIVTVSLAGKVIGGSPLFPQGGGIRLPSSELQVHLQIYVQRHDVGAVVHTHSLYATALSCIHDTIPVIVEEQSQVVGSEIRCTRYVPAGQHQRLGEEVARTLGNSMALLVANHGTVSCGRTLAEAVFTAQIVERVALMRLMTSALGGAISIPHEFVVSERDRWLYKYGKAEDKAAA